MVGLLDELVGLFIGVEGSRNGGLELVYSVCSNIPIMYEMFVSL
jgi:RING finger protein 170